MRLKEFFSYGLMLPIYDIVKGYNIKRDYKVLLDISKWNREDVLGMQRKKLNRLIRHAYETTSFYKTRFDEQGLTPSDITGVDGLRKIPPLRREDIQNGYADLISSEADLSRCYKGSSSGSTGQPVNYIQDLGGGSAGLAALYFGWSLAGWHFGQKYLTIWGNPTCVSEDWSRFSSKVKSWGFREVKVPAYSLIDDKSFRELLDLVKKGGFDYIQGYTNAIYLLANLASEMNESLPDVKGVLTTAENLFPYQRRLIEEVLGPVYDFYGCGEIMGVAFQCTTRDVYHLIDPHVIVEYGEQVDDAGNRELLITDLDNYAMPLIRYANGDMGMPGDSAPCICGLPFGKMKGVSGRVSDVIKTPEGGAFTVPSFFGSRLLKEIKGLVRYQAELVDAHKLRIHLQVNQEYSKQYEGLIIITLEEYIPDSFGWEINYCDEIEMDDSGKFKLFVDSTK